MTNGLKITLIINYTIDTNKLVVYMDEWNTYNHIDRFELCLKQIAGLGRLGLSLDETIRSSNNGISNFFHLLEVGSITELVINYVSCWI